MKGLIPKSALYLRRGAPTILTCIGAVGVAATAVLAAKATPKAVSLLERAAEEKGEDLTKAEAASVAWRLYIPAVAVGIGTIACIFGANTLGRRRSESLASAYILLDKAYKGYRAKVRELYGEDSDGGALEAFVRDKYDEDDEDMPELAGNRIFYEERHGKFFERTEKEVLEAEYHLNRNFALRGYTNLNEFYEFLRLPKTEIGERLGWSFDIGGAFYGYSWVDFAHRTVTMEDGLECVIIGFPFEPTSDYLSEV